MSDCTGCTSAAIRKWYNPTGSCCRELDQQQEQRTYTCRMCDGLIPPGRTLLPYCSVPCFEKDRPRVLAVHDHLLVGSIGRGR